MGAYRRVARAYQTIQLAICSGIGSEWIQYLSDKPCIVRQDIEDTLLPTAFPEFTLIWHWFGV